MRCLSSRAIAAMLTVVALLRRLVPEDMPDMPIMLPVPAFMLFTPLARRQLVALPAAQPTRTSGPPPIPADAPSRRQLVAVRIVPSTDLPPAVSLDANTTAFIRTPNDDIPGEKINAEEFARNATNLWS